MSNLKVLALGFFALSISSASLANTVDTYVIATYAKDKSQYFPVVSKTKVGPRRYTILETAAHKKFPSYMISKEGYLHSNARTKVVSGALPNGDEVEVSEFQTMNSTSEVKPNGTIQATRCGKNIAPNSKVKSLCFAKVIEGEEEE